MKYILLFIALILITLNVGDKLIEHSYLTYSDMVNELYKIPSNTIKMKYSVRYKIKIAILDTGVDFNHPLLKDFKSPSTKIEDTIDNSGHGTHVAGILVRNLMETFGDDAKNLFEIGSFKYNPNEKGSYEKALLKSFKWIPDIVNLSLSGPMKNSFEEKILTFGIKLGINVISSAGNDGTNIDSFPCSIKRVLCVGNLEKQGEISETSNFGSNVQFYAKGTHILSTMPNATHGFLSGTSMSAPVMTAYVASRLITKQADYFFKNKIFRMPPMTFRASYGTQSLKYKDYKLKELASIIN